MVTEGSIEIKGIGEGDSDFELIFSSIIGDDFPVVNSAGEPIGRDHRSENVCLFF